MNGDRSDPDRPELVGPAKKAVLAARTSHVEHVSAALEGWVAVGRKVPIAGNIVHAVILLAARVWLSQAIFVHQIMMMMRAEGFAEAPSVRATLIRSIAPLLLATGLATRPVALALVSWRRAGSRRPSGRASGDPPHLVADRRRRPAVSRLPAARWARASAGLGCEGDQPALRPQRRSRRFRAPSWISGHETGYFSLCILKYPAVAVLLCSQHLKSLLDRGVRIGVGLPSHRDRALGDMPGYRNSGTTASWRPDEPCYRASYAARSVLIRRCIVHACNRTQGGAEHDVRSHRDEHVSSAAPASVPD